jgi:hypothetical protein
LLWLQEGCVACVEISSGAVLVMMAVSETVQPLASVIKTVYTPAGIPLFI